ncbi:hypothetical protein OKW24_003163 [Peribacillus simplex]|uniref:hypothetical protein n=1 Tax=Peribacillus simplex TaxID=1478 RepID=UPI0024E24C04|nr:hypothetical protein [Peribacillus simplex]MDF9761390.1 hypothetical protein [Peribacillus simplex]
MAVPLYKENISLEELNEVEIKTENLIDNFEKQLTAIDDEIFDFEKMKDCFSIYKNSYPLITDYKKSDDKTKFKQENYYQFKQYDMAKRNINFLKKHYGIDEESSFHYKLSLMKMSVIYFMAALENGMKEQENWSVKNEKEGNCSEENAWTKDKN